MDLTPSVCALAADQSRCEERVTIEWQAAGQTQALCLFVDRENEPLACWEKDRQGQYRYRAETDESLTFQLRRTLDGELLASELFEVIREYTEFRSRRRKPWNFF
ncbi:DUF3019 domain-containing protein [Marinimicrobium agarilyticum]|uniref:DUF3019 domain-containing protein n=1 Tax=Marinimicrobium agarilyticum TaxID=306546 RepID=UPI00146EF7BF|nr:DUF3019 domain-containing protein [Marinimicrobium agarilyticum]